LATAGGGWSPLIEPPSTVTSALSGGRGTVWGEERNIIDTHRYRRENDEPVPQIIKTVYRAGYMFTPTVEWSFE
jgi:hypothetical protein